MSNKFCRNYTEKILKKYDKNRSNEHERGELKTWLKREIANTPF